MSTILDVLNKLDNVLNIIYDENWNSVIDSMSSDLKIISKSALEVHINQTPETSEPGARALKANVNSTDPVERILGYFIEVKHTALRLQRSNEDSVPINRRGLIAQLNSTGRRLPDIPDWYDTYINDENFSQAYKTSLREGYQDCSTAIIKLNEFLDAVNSSLSLVLWVQPDPGTPLPTLPQLPSR